MTTQKGLSVEDLITADVFTALMIVFIIVGGMFFADYYCITSLYE